MLEEEKLVWFKTLLVKMFTIVITINDYFNC